MIQFFSPELQAYVLAQSVLVFDSLRSTQIASNFQYFSSLFLGDNTESKMFMQSLNYERVLKLLNYPNPDIQYALGNIYAHNSSVVEEVFKKSTVDTLSNNIPFFKPLVKAQISKLESNGATPNGKRKRKKDTTGTFAFTLQQWFEVSKEDQLFGVVEDQCLTKGDSPTITLNGIQFLVHIFSADPLPSIHMSALFEKFSPILGVYLARLNNFAKDEIVSLPIQFINNFFFFAPHDILAIFKQKLLGHVSVLQRFLAQDFVTTKTVADHAEMFATFVGNHQANRQRAENSSKSKKSKQQPVESLSPLIVDKLFDSESACVRKSLFRDPEYFAYLFDNRKVLDQCTDEDLDSILELLSDGAVAVKSLHQTIMDSLKSRFASLLNDIAENTALLIKVFQRADFISSTYVSGIITAEHLEQLLDVIDDQGIQNMFSDAFIESHARIFPHFMESSFEAVSRSSVALRSIVENCPQHKDVCLNVLKAHGIAVYNALALNQSSITQAFLGQKSVAALVLDAAQAGYDVRSLFRSNPDFLRFLLASPSARVAAGFGYSDFYDLVVDKQSVQTVCDALFLPKNLTLEAKNDVFAFVKEAVVSKPEDLVIPDNVMRLATFIGQSLPASEDKKTNKKIRRSKTMRRIPTKKDCRKQSIDFLAQLVKQEKVVKSKKKEYRDKIISLYRSKTTVPDRCKYMQALVGLHVGFLTCDRMSAKLISDMEVMHLFDRFIADYPKEMGDYINSMDKAEASWVIYLTLAMCYIKHHIHTTNEANKNAALAFLKVVMEVEDIGFICETVGVERLFEALSYYAQIDGIPDVFKLHLALYFLFSGGTFEVAEKQQAEKYLFDAFNADLKAFKLFFKSHYKVFSAENIRQLYQLEPAFVGFFLCRSKLSGDWNADDIMHFVSRKYQKTGSNQYHYKQLLEFCLIYPHVYKKLRKDQVLAIAYKLKFGENEQAVINTMNQYSLYRQEGGVLEYFGLLEDRTVVPVVESKKLAPPPPTRTTSLLMPPQGNGAAGNRDARGDSDDVDFVPPPPPPPPSDGVGAGSVAPPPPPPPSDGVGAEGVPAVGSTSFKLLEQIRQADSSKLLKTFGRDDGEQDAVDTVPKDGMAALLWGALSKRRNDIGEDSHSDSDDDGEWDEESDDDEDRPGLKRSSF